MAKNISAAAEMLFATAEMFFATAEKFFATAEMFFAMAEKFFATAEMFFATAEKLFAMAEKLFATAEKLFAMAEKLFATAEKLFAMAEKFFATAEKLFAMAEMLFAMAEKLFAMAEKLFASAEKLFASAEKFSARTERGINGVLINTVQAIGTFDSPACFVCATGSVRSGQRPGRENAFFISSFCNSISFIYFYMKFQAYDMSSSELHPWNWYVPQDAKCVIVGTFPPTVHRRSFDFFYPNRNNFFWPMMAHIAGCELQSFSGEEAVTERKALLALLQVGVADMGKEIERKKEHDSSDANLLIIRYMPILRMLEEHPSIHTLIFTSSTGKASAFRWFQAYLAENGMECASPQGPRPVYREWSWAGKVYRLVFLYSTSPRIRATISVPALTELFRKEIGPQSTEIVM